MLCYIRYNYGIPAAAFILFFIGLHPELFRYLKQDKSDISSALIGVVAVLIGVWVDRYLGWKEAEKISKEKISNIKTLVTSELVNSVLSLMSLKKLISAAITSQKEDANFSNDLPRPMPFTHSLGEIILLLDKKEIDSLSSLRLNMDMLEKKICEKSKIVSIKKLTKHCLKDFIKCFEQFCPERMLKIDDRNEKIIYVIQRHIDDQDDPNGL